MNTPHNDTPTVKRRYTSWKLIYNTILEAKRSTQEKIYVKLGKHLAKRKVTPRKLAKMLKEVAAAEGFDAKDVRIKVK